MHDRISVNAISFPGASFRDLTDHWRAVGARRVSLISNAIQDEGLPAAQAALGTGDYRVETISHSFCLLGQCLEPRAESWRAARERLTRMIESAQALGAQSIYVMSGGHGPLAWEEAAECFGAALAPCVADAKAAGIRLMVESASTVYADFHIAHTLRDAVTLAEIAGIGVSIDFFSSWMEAGLRDTITRAMPRCHLVQVSDYVYGDRSPGRAVPGDGAIHVKRLIEWVLNAGYGGVFDLELIGPRIDAEGQATAIRRAADYVGEILGALGA